ncbi:MAG: ABC transporter [Acaryochloris sp. SU_5_25]|nr:ABC transporter [Acaryochloris sp. SU_5_25]
MTSDFSNSPQAASVAAISEPSAPTTHRIRQQIRLQIPPEYAQEPVISNLASRYELDVNIHSALLANSNSAQESGWFDLELFGTPTRIQQALAYLSQLHVQIWAGNSALESRGSFRW